MKRTEKLKDIIVLVAIAGFILLWNLGTGSLASWDEAVYAQVSKEMLNSHNYVDLTWAGYQWSDKPPLYMWMTVIFYKIFGVGEFAVRLFSALCGIGTVIITYLLASNLYSRRVAFSSGLILISTWHFIWASKAGMLDAALTFFVSLSIYLFVLGMKRKTYLLFSMLAFGLAFLTKGGGAFLMPIILSIYVIYEKRLGLIREPALWAGLLIVLLVVGGWHLMAFLHYGKEFIADSFIKHLFTRVAHSVEGHEGNLLTYFKAISNKGRPWGIAAFFIIPIALWQIFIKKERVKIALPVIWAVTTIIIFSLVSTKLHWYIVPIYPAISILIGWGIDTIFKKKTVVFVILCFVVSLLYLTFEKKIFNLDYGHETKELAVSFKEKINPRKKIYIYDDDPSVRFYFWDEGVNVFSSLRPEDLSKEKNRYIVLSNKTLNKLDKSKFSVIQQSPDFAIVKVN